MSEQTKKPLTGVSLGKYLAEARVKSGLSLRGVEEATGKEVSNAYLSQLEKDKITKPSPSMLHALSSVYGMPYETLMKYAGYLSPGAPAATAQDSSNKFVIENVTRDEEEALLKYLEFLRFSRKK
jgi:transcriptional regulator with XRE-family HTH domain